MALPIWAKFMTRVYDDESLNVSMGDFEAPLNPPPFETDCSKVEQRETPRDYFRREIF